MPRFLTIGYGDRAGYDATSDALRTAAHAQDAMLRAAGAVIGVAGQPVQVRNPGAGGVKRQEGPFLRSDLPVAGFALIEAADLEDAIQKVANTPCAVAQGVVEVWPLDEL
ncbi:MAG TPA: YciI family protein [Tabrizicola sp.]|nr:YciI family protein [Tabrizicola sp.]